MNKFKTQINQAFKNRFLQGATILFIGAFLVNVLSYIFNIVIGRLLGPVQYGEYLSLISILYILSIPSTTLATVVLKYISLASANQDNKLIKSILIITTRYSLLIIGLFVILSFIFQNQLQALLKLNSFQPIILLIILSIVYIPQNILNSAFNGLQRYTAGTVLNAIGLILRIIFSIILISAGFKLIGVFGAMIVSGLIIYILSWHKIYQWISNDKKYNFLQKSQQFLSKLYNRTPSDQKQIKQELLSFALPATCVTIGLSLLVQSDILLSKIFFSPYQAGIYSSLAIIGKVIPFLVLPLTQAMFPNIISKVVKKQNFLPLFFLILILITTISGTIAIGYIIFPSLVINIFFGKQYLEATQYIGYFGILQALYSLLYFFTTFFLSIEKNKTATIVLLAAFLQIIGIIIFHQTIFQVITVSISVVSATILFYIFSTILLYKQQISK